MKKALRFLVSRMFIFFALIAVQAIFWIMLVDQLATVRPWLQGVFWGLSILLALWITNKNENPGYKIGWLIPILAAPVLGILLYFFFSQRKLGPEARVYAANIIAETRPYLLPDEVCREELKKSDPGCFRQSEYIYASSMYPLRRNTTTKYYPMGLPFFEDLVRDLKAAQKHIFMQYFIIQPGVMLDTVLDILEAKAKEGVDVRFMYDDIGCMSKVPNRFYEQIRARGIQCMVFNPLKPILNSMFNNRDHRKVTVIDGRVAYCSGANLADEYINAVERFGTWKDAAIRLEGEGAWSFLMMFLQTWAFTERSHVDYARFLPERDFDRTCPSDGLVQPFSDSPLDEVSVAQHAYLSMINGAHEYVWINTPYFDVGDEMMKALESAAASGVDVRITVPHIPDKKLVFLLTRAFFPRLIRAGVKIYEYTPGFIHSKTFVCDDKYGMVSTINMDYRSFFLHWECGVWLYESSCLKDMKEDYIRTMAISHEVTYAETQQIGPIDRFVQMVLRVFGPLL